MRLRLSLYYFSNERSSKMSEIEKGMGLVAHSFLYYFKLSSNYFSRQNLVVFFLSSIFLSIIR